MNKLIFASFLLLISCNKNQTDLRACSEKDDQFYSMQSLFYKNCVVACIKANVGSISKEKGSLESQKNRCDSGCRDAIPFDQINKLKEYVNTTMGCSIGYNKSL